MYESCEEVQKRTQNEPKQRLFNQCCIPQGKWDLKYMLSKASWVLDVGRSRIQGSQAELEDLFFREGWEHLERKEWSGTLTTKTVSD